MTDTSESCVAARRAEWVQRVGDAQMAQFLLSGEDLVVLRALTQRLIGRSTAESLHRNYKRTLADASERLGAGDRLEAVKRLGPVMPGMSSSRNDGAALVALFTAQLFHTAFADVRAQMNAILRGYHDQVGVLVGDVWALAQTISASPGHRKAAEALAESWQGSCAELADMVRTIVDDTIPARA